jgi:hypothetical protein
MPAAPIDYDRLMKANLNQVFGEHDAGRRIKAIHRLYAEDALLIEPHIFAKGHAAINEAVTTLLGNLPHTFIFRATDPVIGYSNIAQLKWSAGPQDGPVAVSGVDIAYFEGNMIRSLSLIIERTHTYKITLTKETISDYTTVLL